MQIEEIADEKQLMNLYGLNFKATTSCCRIPVLKSHTFVHDCINDFWYFSSTT